MEKAHQDETLAENYLNKYESFKNAAKALSERVKPGDLVITCGAGNIYQAGEKLLDELKKNVSEKEGK